MRKKRKKIFNIEEINAYRVAYGSPIQRKDLFKSIVVPFFMCFLFVFLLFFNWWISALAGLGGVIYSFSYIIPRNEKRSYELKSFQERNKFVNNMTQILTNENRTVLQAIQIVTERAEGEFREHLMKLQLDLVDGSNDTIQEAFKTLETKYAEDVMFVQYIEQLNTAFLEGRSNLDTLKDIKSYHNMIKDRQNSFFIAKDSKLRDFKFMIRVGLAFIGMLIFSFGIRQYIDVYTEGIIGWVSSSIYLVLIGMIYHSFERRMADDSVLEVKL